MSGATYNAFNHVPNVIRRAMPAGWRDGLCPECDRFARWSVQSDMFAPSHGRVECCFCDAEGYFEIETGDDD